MGFVPGCTTIVATEDLQIYFEVMLMLSSKLELLHVTGALRMQTASFLFSCVGGIGLIVFTLLAVVHIDSEGYLAGPTPSSRRCFSEGETL